MLSTARNDKTPVGEDVLSGIVDEIGCFGGATVEMGIIGHWRDPDGKEHKREVNWKVTVFCDRSMYVTAVDFVLKVGRQLGQKEMYFEVRDFDGVQLLKVDG